VVTTETRVAELRRLIDDANHRYHVLDAPTVDDGEYDGWVRELRALAPVVFDGTHSVQTPSAANGVSGGQPEFIPVLARAAVASPIRQRRVQRVPREHRALHALRQTSHARERAQRRGVRRLGRAGAQAARR